MLILVKVIGMNFQNHYDKMLIEDVIEDQIERKAANRLGSGSPLKTLFISSIGPFISTIISATFGIVDCIWISKACGQNGVASVSLCTLLERIGRSFSMCLNVAASSHLSHLRGENQTNQIVQVFADLLRTCFIFGLVIPLICVPMIKPTLTFFGATPEMFEMGRSYIMPQLVFSVAQCFNYFFCGVLQSEGKTFTYGFVQVSSALLNMFVFDPLFLITMKMGMFGAGLATIVSETIPTIIVSYSIIKRSRIRWSHLTSKFSQETFIAYKIGFTQWIATICYTLPNFFSRKYISEITRKSDSFAESLAAYGFILKFWNFPASYAFAMSVGFLPAASFAVGAVQPKRLIELLKWSLILSTMWCIFSEIVLFSCAKYLALMLSSSEKFQILVCKMIKSTYSCVFTLGIQYITVSFMQSIQEASKAIVLPILTRFLPVPLFGTILFFTDKENDIMRQLRMYSFGDLFASMICIIFMIPSIMKWKSNSSEKPLNLNLEGAMFEIVN